MKKYLKENGFLSDEGKEFVEQFKEQLLGVLNHRNTEYTTTAEIQTLGSNLMKIVADAISERVQKAHKWENNPFYNMSDEKFKEYLSDKYKSPLQSLTPDEFERYGPIAKAQTEEIMKEMSERRKNYTPPPMPCRPSRRGPSYK